MKTENPPGVRAAISFAPDVYKRLEKIAKQKKVSVGWVVREAAEKYVAAEWPLTAFGGHVATEAAGCFKSKSSRLHRA